MDDLITWFRGVLDEDERLAREATGSAWGVDEYTEIGTRMVERFAAPASVRADIAAKRAVLDLHIPGPTAHYPNRCPTCTEEVGSVYDLVQVPIPCPTVRLLASAYADRPGYQESWRP